MPRRSASGGGSEQRARAGSLGAPGGSRFGGRADFRERLLGSAVLGSDDLAIAELFFDELADEVVVEGFGQILGRLGMRDLHAFVKVVSRGKVALRELVQARVLEMPNRSCLTDQGAFETNDARLLADDLRVLADLALGCRAFFFAHIGWERELRDFATHVGR